MEKVNYKGENGFYDETAGFIPLSAMEKVNSNGQNGYYNEKIGFVPDDLSQQPQQPAQQTQQTQQPSGFMDILKKVAMANPNMQLAQSLPTALSNAPSDAYNTSIKPFTTPVETAEGLGKLMAGGLRGIGNALPIKPIIDYVIPKEYEKYPTAVIDSYIEKYGSLDKAKQTFEKEPIGTLLDLSTVLTGTGALAQGLKAPKLAAAGKVMSDVGKAIEPLSATTKVLGGALSPLKKLATATEGTLTGIGTTNIEEGIKAITKGGTSKKAFLEARKGNISPAQIYEEAKEGLGEVTNKLKSDYESKLATISKDTQTLDVLPIEQRFDSLIEKLRGKKTGDPETPFTFKGTSVTPNEESLINNLYKRFRDEHVAAAGEGGLSPLALNDFKNYVSKFYSESGIKSKAVAEIRNSVNDVLKQVPGYEEMQGSYRKALQIEDEFSQAIGNPDKKIADSAVTKLTNALKQDKSYAKNFIKTLEESSGKEITAKIAGLSMKPIVPQNMIGKAFLAGPIAAAVMGNPALVAQTAGVLAFTSPKVLGYLVQAIGDAKRISGKVKQSIPTGVRLGALQAGKLGQQNNQ